MIRNADRPARTRRHRGVSRPRMTAMDKQTSVYARAPLSADDGIPIYCGDSDFREHVLDLNLTVKNVLATVRPGGLLFVRTPWREDLSIYLKDDYPFQYHHVRSFDEHGYRLLLEKIFPCKVLEHRLIGYSVCPERRRWMVPFCGRATKYSRAVSRTLHDRLIRLFYMPLKIVVVAQKL